MEAVTKVVRTFGSVFCYLVVKPFFRFCWTVTKFSLVLCLSVGIFAGIMRLVSLPTPIESLPNHDHIVEKIVVSQNQRPPELKREAPGRPSHYSSPPPDVEYNYDLDVSNGSFPNIVEIPSILSDLDVKKRARMSKK